MSFVNLMADDDWSEGSILDYTERHVRSGFGVEEIPILRDKLLGQIMGTHPLTPDEQADVARYEARKLEAKAMADAARADMALLRQAWAVEAGLLDPAAVTQDVTDLLALRAAARATPEPTPDPAPEPQP
jgi:hypothetical protein